MATRTNRERSILSVTETLSDVLQNQLPKLWSTRDRPPDFFKDGINWISVSVKAGLVEVSLSVGGKEAPLASNPGPVQLPNSSGRPAS